MTLKTINGSYAIAEAVKDCKVEVVAAYPITPSTYIPHALNKYYANGEIPKFIAVEAEFSAISAVQGASAAGARAFTATSSQGLLLMHEALFATSGMRLPVVAVVANRAISAPLSIWTDEQDTISQRDTGWIQIYCKNNQQAVDSVVQAFRIAEKVMLPVMVCVDGFYLTHSVEQIDVPEKEKIAAYLPAYENQYKLDPQNPLTLGAYATPPDYQEFREDLCNDLDASTAAIEAAGKEFAKAFGREYGLLEYYKCDDADRIMLTIGSMACNIERVVDALRAKGEKVGCCHLRVLRPFPRDALKKGPLKGRHVLVVERDISPGGVPPIYAEVSEAMAGTGSTVSYAVGALGGREIKAEEIEQWLMRMKEGKQLRDWMGRNEQKKPAGKIAVAKA